MSARASNGFSLPIKKNSCRLSNCANVCPRCASANKRCAPNCKRSLTRPMIAPTSCVWQKLSGLSWPVYAAPADTLDVTERQRIVRLVIKEILVGDDTIIIRHCIPVASGPRQNDGSPPTPGGADSAPRDRSYLLRKGSDIGPAGGVIEKTYCCSVDSRALLQSGRGRSTRIAFHREGAAPCRDIAFIS